MFKGEGGAVEEIKLEGRMCRKGEELRHQRKKWTNVQYSRFYKSGECVKGA